MKKIKEILECIAFVVGWALLFGLSIYTPVFGGVNETMDMAVLVIAGISGVIGLIYIIKEAIKNRKEGKKFDE